MNHYKEYQIGKGIDSRSVNLLWVGYRPTGPNWAPGESIYIQIGFGRGAEGPVCTPKEMLTYQPHIYPVVEGNIVSNNLELEPPGWFERKCREANCEWFIPMVKRMAEGEHVPLEEIQAAYLAQNGKPMPCGKWSQLFQ